MERKNESISRKMLWLWYVHPNERDWESPCGVQKSENKVKSEKRSAKQLYLLGTYILYFLHAQTWVVDVHHCGVGVDRVIDFNVKGFVGMLIRLREILSYCSLRQVDRASRIIHDAASFAILAQAGPVTIHYNLVIVACLWFAIVVVRKCCLPHRAPWLV